MYLRAGCAVIAAFTLLIGNGVTNALDKEAEDLILYPAPEGVALSEQYAVTVNGKPLDVYFAPVREEAPGDNYFGGPYSFAYFDFAGTVEVEVRSRRPLDQTRILPESRGIVHQLKGDGLYFTLDKPCQLAIEPDWKNGPLLLFANPVENERPQPDAAGVVYFGPGVHKPGKITLTDNQTLYIAGGAVVKGGVEARGENIRIAGRGIIDGLDWPRYKGPSGNIISMRATNSSVEGVILKDSWSWTFVLLACSDIRIDNVKICSTRCANNDGIDVVNSQRVTIENTFVRSEDDSIAVKGYGHPDRDRERDGMAVEDLMISNCVLWSDNANVWRLGYECWAEAMRRMTFKQIDVLHGSSIVLQPGEDMLMEDVLFEDIRVNGEVQIELNTRLTYTFRRKTPGRIRNVTFKNVAYSCATPGENASILISGSDVEHTVEGVTFDHVERNETLVTETSTNVRVLAHTDKIVFK